MHSSLEEGKLKHESFKAEAIQLIQDHQSFITQLELKLKTSETRNENTQIKLDKTSQELLNMTTSQMTSNYRDTVPNHLFFPETNVIYLH